MILSVHQQGMVSVTSCYTVHSVRKQPVQGHVVHVSKGPEWCVTRAKSSITHPTTQWWMSSFFVGPTVFLAWVVATTMSCWFVSQTLPLPLSTSSFCCFKLSIHDKKFSWLFSSVAAVIFISLRIHRTVLRNFMSSTLSFLAFKDLYFAVWKNEVSNVYFCLY